MARAYTAPAPAYTQANTATDVASLATTATTVLEIDELDMNQATATTVANVSMSVLRFSGAYSVASGGSSGTIAKHLFGDSASPVTALYNNSVQASAGTSVTIYADAVNIINGWQKLPAPEDRWSFTISQAFIWRTAAPTAGTYSNSVAYRETV